MVQQLKERMLEEARKRSPETSDQLQVDLWRLAEVGDEAVVPAWKLEMLLHYVEDLEKTVAKLSGDKDGESLPGLRKRGA